MLKGLSIRLKRPSSSSSDSSKKSDKQGEEVEKTKIVLNPNENLVGKVKPPEHMFQLLSSQTSAFYFYRYVSKKFSSETLSFWVSVEHFKCKVAHNDSVAYPYAKEIFDTYLKRFSEKEVNLEGEQHNLDLSEVSLHTFNDLQDKAWQLLVNSDYQKFITSPDYKEYIEGKPVDRVKRSPTVEKLEEIIQRGISFNPTDKLEPKKAEGKVKEAVDVIVIEDENAETPKDSETNDEVKFTQWEENEAKSEESEESIEGLVDNVTPSDAEVSNEVTLTKFDQTLDTVALDDDKKCENEENEELDLDALELEQEAMRLREQIAALELQVSECAGEGLSVDEFNCDQPNEQDSAENESSSVDSIELVEPQSQTLHEPDETLSCRNVSVEEEPDIAGNNEDGEHIIEIEDLPLAYHTTGSVAYTEETIDVFEDNEEVFVFNETNAAETECIDENIENEPVSNTVEDAKLLQDSKHENTSENQEDLLQEAEAEDEDEDEDEDEYYDETEIYEHPAVTSYTPENPASITKTLLPEPQSWDEFDNKIEEFMKRRDALLSAHLSQSARLHRTTKN